jgi:hypothetical protein
MNSRYFHKSLTYVKQRPSLIFPIILVVIFILLVAFKINGSSIGIYHNYLYGNNVKDNNLVYGNPRGIRSDEWLVNTQMTLAQEENGYARFNPNFNENKDMSLVIDAPYIDWSAVFKPQNFSFFVMPFEYAFSFKWWLLLLSLLLSAYYFTLKILPKKIILAIFVSLITGFSPFVFWWYQSSTVETLTFGFLLIMIGMSIVDKTELSLFGNKVSKNWSIILKTTSFAYILSCFALILYPPFQIPMIPIIGLFLLGYTFNKKRTYLKKNWRIIFIPLISAAVFGVVVSGAFVLTRSDVVKTISSTVYPGKRVIKTGGYDVKKLLVTYLQPLLQIDSKGMHYGMNQSEASNFILTPLYFIIPFIALFTWLYVKQKNFDWVLFCLILCNLLFLADLFIPNIDIIARVTFLYLVPHDRLLIGMGMLTIVSLVYAVKVYINAKIKFNRRIVIAMATYLLLLFLSMIWAGLATSHEYPLFVSSRLLILLLTACVLIGISLILFKKFKLGLAIIAIFSIASVVTIHPLYRGLGPIYKSEIGETIRSLSPASASWGAAESIMVENLPEVSGRSAVTGVAAYPDNAFWKKFSEMKDDAIYNRYAHVILTSADANALTLIGADNFVISEGCERKVSQEINYIISTAPLSDSCDHLLKTLSYPNVTFYFYKR